MAFSKKVAASPALESLAKHFWLHSNKCSEARSGDRMWHTHNWLAQQRSLPFRKLVFMADQAFCKLLWSVPLIDEICSNTYERAWVAFVLPVGCAPEFICIRYAHPLTDYYASIWPQYTSPIALWKAIVLKRSQRLLLLVQLLGQLEEQTLQVLLEKSLLLRRIIPSSIFQLSLPSYMHQWKPCSTSILVTTNLQTCLRVWLDFGFSTRYMQQIILLL